MTTTAKHDWIKDFGLDDRKPPHFFSSLDQLDAEAGKAPQPHALRRAFEQLGIDGVLCQERSPVVYFRQVTKIDADEIVNLHRSFWNQGIAPILVVIAPNEVHVYSGLIPPDYRPTGTGKTPGFIETLNRVQDQLRSFLLSVESGGYFHVHRRSFDPHKRVDRDLLRNLRAARQELGQVEAARLEQQTLDALLCRLVFTSYLFDRGIIDAAYLKAIRIHRSEHLKDILAKKPRTDAKAELYKLFEQLGNDFNGDLFSADLEAERRQLKVEHLEVLDKFFQDTDVKSGQRSLFSRYDFSFIPIETISAIYENFLKAAGERQKKEAGAFYTPRFLAEFVLDVALEGETSLLDKRFLDPACGSGIFLVGLFNRLAEEWKLKNPVAPYDRRANGLMDILRTNLRGVDSNPSACQITAFSLYLALLDQLSPPDIRKLLGKWDRLPPLVFDPEQPSAVSACTIRRADFFADVGALFKKVHVIVGNPPWGPIKKGPPTRAEEWCVGSQRKYIVPNREKSIPFIWKAPTDLHDDGKVCFVLPHGVLFNHSNSAVRFQQALIRAYSIDRVINLCDLQRFLFEDSEAPAIVVRYRKEAPADGSHLVDYWAPKTDWSLTQAEIVAVRQQDRSRLTIREVLDDLRGDDAPLIWKSRLWATPRDRRLLDRLLLMSRLREIVGSASKPPLKRWVIGQGFEERGQSGQTKQLLLPTRAIIEATSPHLHLFLLKDDCATLPTTEVAVRKKSNTYTGVYRSPLVLITHGYSRIAFADFDVSFRHALRGIHGPKEDRDLLVFLAAYLRSNVARYFLFHTSSNWGVSRAKVHVDELLRLPFPLPENTHDPKRCRAIVREIATVVARGASEASRDFIDRAEIVRRTQESVNGLIEEYFDIDDIERMLIADTAKVVIPSARPSRGNPNIETIKPGNDSLRASYIKLLCDRLNSWANHGYQVHGRTCADSAIGVGMVVLEKTKRGEESAYRSASDGELLNALDSLQHTAAKKHGTFELVRGAMVFHKNLLYITKPLGQRFWTNTAALNDADEIAATILTRSVREGA